MHRFPLDWDAERRLETKEPPLAKLERLSKFYEENRCVASPLLLRSLGIEIEPLASAQQRGQRDE